MLLILLAKGPTTVIKRSMVSFQSCLLDFIRNFLDSKFSLFCSDADLEPRPTPGATLDQGSSQSADGEEFEDVPHPQLIDGQCRHVASLCSNP